MASSDKVPVACPASTGEGKEPMGDPTKTTTAMLDKGTAMLQSMKPIKQMSLHVCSFACYSHDPGRQIEVHIYDHRVNHDFLQCAVYDSSSSNVLVVTLSIEAFALDYDLRFMMCFYCIKFLGIEYIVSEKLFESLSPEEQKLWHSHDYKVLDFSFFSYKSFLCVMVRRILRWVVNGRQSYMSLGREREVILII